MAFDEKCVVDDFLTQIGVEHRFVHHPTVTSIQEVLEKGIPQKLGVPLGNLLKNLLVRDTSHSLYLVVTPGMKTTSLSAVARTMGTSHLSIARLEEARGLFGDHKGSVSLFDILKMAGSDSDSGEAPAVDFPDVCVAVDASVKSLEGNIAFSAGSLNESVTFPAEDLEKVVNEIGSRTSSSVRFLTL